MVFMKTYLEELHVKYMSNNADDVGPLYNQGRVITSIEQMPHISPEVKEWAKNQVKLWPGVAPAVAKKSGTGIGLGGGGISGGGSGGGGGGIGGR